VLIRKKSGKIMYLASPECHTGVPHGLIYQASQTEIFTTRKQVPADLGSVLGRLPEAWACEIGRGSISRHMQALADCEPQWTHLRAGPHTPAWQSVVGSLIDVGLEVLITLRRTCRIGLGARIGMSLF
jgi:tRNA G46 methylase TrmB